MTPVDIAFGIVSVLMLVSRFVNSAKPIWDRFPKPVAVLLPPIVVLIPQVVDIIDDTKTWADLVNYLIAAAALVVVGLFPKKADEATQGSDTGVTSSRPNPPR